MKANQKIIRGTVAAIAGAAAISMGIISTATPIMAANTISKETAKSIALKHAGINASQIYNFEIDLDNERNGVFYDVEFDSNGYEYEYRINASNASIVNVEKKALNKNTDVVYKNGAWTYVKNNRPDYSYSGFAKNPSGWWYIEKGKVSFRKNGVIHGTVNGISGWWNVKGSKVIFNNSVESNEHGWWVIRNGKVDFNYNGFAKNSSGWWWIENGKVTFRKNDVLYGTVEGKSGWWNVKGSKVIFNNSVEGNRHGWWVIRNGKVDFNYNGFANNSSGWWYIENGKVTFRKNDVLYGTVEGKSGWWNVKGSKVIFNNSVEGNRHGWWVIRNGKVDFNYNGFANNSSGWWYIENGKVSFRKNGIIKGTIDGRNSSWTVKNSKVVGESTPNKTNTNKAFIGAEKAKQISLSHAGLTTGSVWELKCDLDYENGTYIYEVEFKSGRYEYDYDIDAYTGKIIRSNKELD